MRSADGVAGGGKKASAPYTNSRYHKTSRTILSGCDDQMRTFKQPEEYGRNNLDFLNSIFADKSKHVKPTHAELRTMAINEKKINMRVKEERQQQKQERARKTALLRAQQNVLQAQLEIDDYKRQYRNHEVFVFKPSALDECHDHVKVMEKLWRDDVMQQMQLHRKTPSTFHRLQTRGAEGLNMTMAIPGMQRVQSSSSSVESAQLVVCIAQVISKERDISEVMETVQNLLSEGADVNCSAESDNSGAKEGSLQAAIQDGHTPLMLASTLDDTALCRVLIEKKADIAQVSAEDGRTALTVAILNRKFSTLKMLIEEAARQDIVDSVVNPSSSQNVSMLPLELAINLNEVEMVRILVANGADMATRGSTHLLKAICLGSYEISEILLQAGCPLMADVDACHMDEVSIAALSGRFDILRLLFEHYPDLCVEKEEHLNEERRASATSLPTKETSIFSPHPIVRQVFAFEIEDALFYAGAVNRIVHKHRMDISTMPPPGMTAEEQAMLDKEPLHEQSKSMKKKNPSMLRKPSMGGVSAADHHDMAKERSAYSSFVEHELRVEDIFAHWVTQQTYSGGRCIRRQTNLDSDDEDDEAATTVDAASLDAEMTDGRHPKSSLSIDPPTTPRSNAGLTTESRTSSAGSQSHNDNQILPHQPSGEQEHFLLQRYDKYFDDVVRLLLFQLRLQCHNHDMEENFHAHVSKTKELNRRASIEPDRLSKGGKKEQWSTTDVKPEPFGKWYRTHFMLFSKLVQRFGRPVLVAFKQHTVSQIVRAIGSRYVRNAPRDDDGDGEVDEPDEVDVAGAAAAAKAAALSKHHDHETQERLMFAISRDDPVEAMIQILGFHAAATLTIGTVFSRSQYFNAAADETTQALIKSYGPTSMLLYAVYRRAPRVVEALLLLKADANASDKYGVTPLMLAAHQADATGTRIVRDILRHAAGSVDPFLVTSPDIVSGGVNVFYIAAQRGRLETLQILVELTREQILRERIKQMQSSPRRTSFFIAQQAQDPVRTNLNVQTLDNSTPLLVAVYFGFLDVIQYLLAQGASLNAHADASDDSESDEESSEQNSKQKESRPRHSSHEHSLVLFNALEAEKAPPQDIAVRRKHSEVIKVLLKAGASLDTTYGDARLLCGQPVSLLMMAVFHGDLDSIKSFIDLGADISWTPRSDGYTAAHFAVMLFDLEIIKFISEHPKVKVNESLRQRTAAGEDCFDLMKRWYHVELNHAIKIDPHMLVTRNSKALEHDAQKVWATHCPTGRLVSLDGMRGILHSMELHLHFPVDEELDCFTNIVLCRADADRDGIIGIKQFSSLFGHLSKVEALYEFLVKNGLLVPDSS